MQDNFSSYVAQLKETYKDVKFKPVVFNGILEDNQPSGIPVHLFCSIQDITEAGIDALTINAGNSNIECITIFLNDSDSEPISHDKITYVKTSKQFGLRLVDITSHFNENKLNVFMYDIIVFDSTVYLEYLTKTQVGIFSAKVFDKIPSDPSMFKALSTYTKINTEFNALVVLGKIEDYDLFIDMYGSINMLISYLSSKYEIVNLSNIVVSYLFEKKTYTGTYISDKFPVVYATTQLYFMEDLNVIVPEEDVFVEFTKEIADCVVLEDIEYTQEDLPLEDQLLLTNIKNKLRSDMLLKYKAEYSKHIESIRAQCNEICEVQKREKLAELDSFFEQERKTRREALEVHSEQDKQAILRAVQEMEKVNKAEVKKKRASELKKIDTEVQKKIERERVKLNKTIEETKNRAYIDLKQEIEVFTKNAYAKLDEQLKEHKALSIKGIEEQNICFNKQELHRINEEHVREKERLEQLLTEYGDFKRQEIASYQEAEQLEHFSKSILEIETELATVKQKRTREIEAELILFEEKLEKTLRTEEEFKRKETKHIIKMYQDNEMKKADLHIKELMEERLKTEERQLENHVRLLRESRIKEMESEELARIKQECLIIKEELLKQIHLEVEVAKRTEYEKSTFESDTKLSLLYEEKLNQQQRTLLEREAELMERQDVAIQQLKVKKLLDFDETIRVKISERAAELQDYKTNQMKEINVLLEQYKANELRKFEMVKTLQDNELVEYRSQREKEIEGELSNQRQLKLKESKAQVVKEKTKLNAQLEQQFKDALETKNKDQEKEYATKLQEKLEVLEREHEVLISKVLSSSKRQYDDYVEEIKKDKVELEKSVIEQHNKQLKDLEEEYQEKIDFHKSMLKESITDERHKLLLSEKEGIAKELGVYKKERMAELDQEFVQEISKRKQERLLSIEKEVSAHKEEKLKEVTAELSEWKRSQEEIIKKKFKSLYSDLQTF